LCSCHAFIRGQKLRDAAQALCDRWDTPLWKDAPHTGEYIAALREALRNEALAEMQALTESEYRQNTLVCLSETHQQLGEQLGGEYELIGSIYGTHAGRWLLWAENKAAVWPVNTAVYVKRVKR
jgi:hypothetical protein